MVEPVIQNVSDTAFMVARYRAVETERPDALFQDPLAERLAGEHGKRIVAALPRRAVAFWSVAVRTVAIDALIESALARGVDTVLNLGAGLDTRPYRMHLPPALRWVEADYAPMIDLKESRLAAETPRCELERVRIDLTDVTARRRLFDDVGARARHVLVLTEGVIPYIGIDDVAALADDLRRMTAARSWIVDYFSPATVRYRSKEGRHFLNAPFKFVPDDWFAFFASHGWQVKERRFLVEEGERLNRPLPLPALLRALMKLREMFVARTSRESFREFAGYFLLEPQAN